MKIYKAVFIICLIFPLTVFSQYDNMYPDGKYDDKIPKPEEIIGHQLGKIHTFHWEMESYIKAVEKSTDKVQIKEYGKTYEGRSLYYLIISTPENMAQLEKIRETNLKLTDPRITSPEQINEIAKWMPSIVWIGYNIHGGEASGMEAAIRTIYQLAAGTDDNTQNILNNLICIIDPCQNPDGHERFANYVRSIVTVNSHPQNEDVEHSGPWPGSRTNHYLFDLNRDFFLKTQIESYRKAIAYHHWMPHVFADLHEMGTNSTYYFAPPRKPYNEFILPESIKWWDIIAKSNALAFDRYGWGYYTKDSFDAYYPGKGSMYSTINGAIGMTYEQASARGVSIKRDDGTILTLREALWHHFTASMATFQAVAERRKEKIIDFYNFFVKGMQEADKEQIKEIIIPSENDPHLLTKLIDNLLIENVEIFKIKAPITVKKAFSYMTRKTVSKNFPAGSYIIRLKQPQKILVKALLAPSTRINEDFIEAEFERKKNRERSLFYNTMSWSMPLTYGIDCYWTGEISKVETEPVTSPPLISDSIPLKKAQQVYLIPFEGTGSSKLLIKLFENNYNVRIAGKSFTIDGKKWPEGTLVIRVNRNPESIHKKIKELADEYGVTVTAVDHGLTPEGVDLGSGNIQILRKPKIALFTESPVSSYSYGTIHYLFEREFDLHFTRLNIRNISNLDDYNVVILPSGSYSNAVSKSQIENFKSWIRSGGTVIALSRTVNWLTNKDVKISNLKLLDRIPDPNDKSKKIRPDRTPGAICRVNLNPESFLSYGGSPSVAVFVQSSNIYPVFKENTQRNAGVYAKLEDLKLSGFIWPETEKYLSDSGWLFVERFGRGKVISFVEDPCFRASYYGLNKLFLNAILLGPSLN